VKGTQQEEEMGLVSSRTACSKSALKSLVSQITRDVVKDKTDCPETVRFSPNLTDSLCKQWIRFDQIGEKHRFRVIPLHY
jgi:hypothetical protein